MENKGLIVNLLNRFNDADDKAIACSIYDGNQLTDITYLQMLQDVLRAAGFFVEHHIKNQHIAIAAPNSYNWLVTLYGIMASGNTAVFLNVALPADALKAQCTQADATVFCCQSNASDELKGIAEDMKLLYLEDITTESPIDLANVYNASDDETIILLGTSGTTGKSKIVEISSGNLSACMSNTTDAAGVSGLDRVLIVFPLFHIGGTVSATLALYRKKTLCIGRGFQYIFSDMSVLNPTYSALVPSAMESLEKIYKGTSDSRKRSQFVGNNFQRICLAGAAPKLSTCQYLMSQGIVIETSYGMTESTGSGTWSELELDNIKTIGKQFGSIEIRIRDGELLMKGDAVMKGYYKDPVETAKVIEDGWLHTGDMGYCDENGYYYITGRKKNVIILSNGENVNPEEIEAKWGSCTHILECMVYSDGKGICADVYTENKDAAAAYIKEYNNEMPMYRQVYKVNYSSEPLEKTSTGKIKRKENK